MGSHYFRTLTASLIAGLILGVACSSPPVRHLSTEEERLRREMFIGTQLSEQAAEHFELKKNYVLQRYLKKLTLQLLRSEKKSEINEVSVDLIDDRHGLWRSFVVPGNRFFISLGLLQSIEYENELAALLSIQLSLLSRRSMLQRIESIAKSKSSDALKHLTWDSVLNFSVEDEIESMRQSVGVLYRAGFDPRGLISLIQLYGRNPDHTPYSESKQQIFIDKLRREIAQLPPLRNPIVKTDEFMQMKKRINKL